MSGIPEYMSGMYSFTESRIANVPTVYGAQCERWADTHEADGSDGAPVPISEIIEWLTAHIK